MQELKLFQVAATLYACRTSPPSLPHIRDHYLQQQQLGIDPYTTSKHQHHRLVAPLNLNPPWTP